MGSFKRAGNPQGYGYVLTDTLVNNSFVCWDPTVAATSVPAAGAYGAMRPQHVGIGNSGAFFLGVLQGQNPASSNIDNANPLEPFDKLLVVREGIFTFKTTASETYVHGTAVYAADAGDDLTITTVSGGGHLVGYVNLPDGSQVTGATGVTVNVELSQNLTYTSNAIASA